VGEDAVRDHHDEHGGFFDHVTPEPALPDPNVPPNPNAPQFPADEVEGDIKNRDVRVPALVVSPWVEPGQVSSELFDHTSIIKTILQRFCGPEQIDRLGPRVQAANHLGFMLKGSAPRLMARSLIGAPTGRGALPTALRNDLLSKLGKRMRVAAGRPRPDHPPYELEQQIVEARQFLRREASAVPEPPEE
jgi:phospholipase C